MMTATPSVSNCGLPALPIICKQVLRSYSLYPAVSPVSLHHLRVPLSTTRWAGKLTPIAKVDVVQSTCSRHKVTKPMHQSLKPLNDWKASPGSATYLHSYCSEHVFVKSWCLVYVNWYCFLVAVLLDSLQQLIQCRRCCQQLYL